MHSPLLSPLGYFLRIIFSAQGGQRLLPFFSRHRTGSGTPFPFPFRRTAYILFLVTFSLQSNLSSLTLEKITPPQPSSPLCFLPRCCCCLSWPFFFPRADACNSSAADRVGKFLVFSLLLGKADLSFLFFKAPLDQASRLKEVSPSACTREGSRFPACSSWNLLFSFLFSLVLLLFFR